MIAEIPSDDDIDAELSAAIMGYDPNDNYPEWSNASMREAYRAGWEDGRLAASDDRTFCCALEVGHDGPHRAPLG